MFWERGTCVVLISSARDTGLGFGRDECWEMKRHFAIHKSLEQCMSVLVGAWHCRSMAGATVIEVRCREAEVTVSQPHVHAAGVVEMTSQTSARGQQLTFLLIAA